MQNPIPLFENFDINQTYESVEDWLDYLGVKNYTIADDLTVSVIGDVNLSNKRLFTIPIQFSTIDGNLNVSSNNLVSLKGCPNKVAESFDCSHNELTSLIGCPIQVGGYYKCSDNELTTSDGFAGFRR